jgi:hypothetical protein
MMRPKPAGTSRSPNRTVEGRWPRSTVIVRRPPAADGRRPKSSRPVVETLGDHGPRHFRKRTLGDSTLHRAMGPRRRVLRQPVPAIASNNDFPLTIEGPTAGDPDRRDGIELPTPSWESCPVSSEEALSPPASGSVRALSASCRDGPVAAPGLSVARAARPRTTGVAGTISDVVRGDCGAPGKGRYVGDPSGCRAGFRTSLLRGPYRQFRDAAAAATALWAHVRGRPAPDRHFPYPSFRATHGRHWERGEGVPDRAFRAAWLRSLRWRRPSADVPICARRQSPADTLRCGSSGTHGASSDGDLAVTTCAVGKPAFRTPDQLRLPAVRATVALVLEVAIRLVGAGRGGGSGGRDVLR